MLCLSLRKPYADWILQGRKTIEIRHWNIPKKCSLPMTVFIHTSKTIDEKMMTANDQLPSGCIVGSITITGVKKYASREEFMQDKEQHLAGTAFYAERRTYGFVLKDPVPVKPRPYKGMLGFFEVDLKP